MFDLNIYSKQEKEDRVVQGCLQAEESELQICFYNVKLKPHDRGHDWLGLSLVHCRVKAETLGLDVDMTQNISINTRNSQDMSWYIKKTQYGHFNKLENRIPPIDSFWSRQ